VRQSEVATYDREEQLDIAADKIRMHIQGDQCKTHSSHASDNDNTPIRAFCIKYDIPTWLSIPFIRKTEAETQRFIDEWHAVFHRFEERIRADMEQVHIDYRTPYGYRNILVPDDQEQAILARMSRMREQGMTCCEVGEQLDREGVKAKRSASWSANSVCRLTNQYRRKE